VHALPGFARGSAAALGADPGTRLAEGAAAALLITGALAFAGSQARRRGVPCRSGAGRATERVLGSLPRAARGGAEGPEPEDKEEDIVLLCAACGADVTTTSRCEGTTPLANPGRGPPMYIGRFSGADGVEAVGSSTSEESFFSGCTWQMGLCRGCGAHVGWFYENSGSAVASEPFWGLLWSRLEKSRSRAQPPR